MADITYLPTNDNFVYLSLVTDAYSRKIVGCHVHDSLQTEPVALALKMALRKRQSDQRLVHHSDRCIQYCSSYYQAIHQRHGLMCSMTDGYDCYQNALTERVNGILKGGCCYRVRLTWSRLGAWCTSRSRSITQSAHICR